MDNQKKSSIPIRFVCFAGGLSLGFSSIEGVAGRPWATMGVNGALVSTESTIHKGNDTFT